ncbi:hypothetical protein ABT297_26260 [Dactylosporangium sp. NPDC000555]|uniref:hypothetical protein n=1 Tax=Dactylosporangium sp. NPDC000555 TaxID=3154260 RepID=UPI0033202472
MKLKVIAVTAAAIAAAALAPAQAAMARPATASGDSCYGFNYSYSINSSAIQVTASNACPGTSTAYLVLERYNVASGYWAFVTSSTSGSLIYICNGTTPNTYHIGPIFKPGISGYTWYEFTDNCG